MDEEKIKRFWQERGRKYEKLSFESVANLEEDPENLKLKIRDEQKKVFSWFSPADKAILDLGAGIGQWAFRFQERGAVKVDAVEYSESFIAIGMREADIRDARGVNFIHSAAQDFQPSSTYDVIFISGLFVYLEDGNSERVIKNLRNAMNKNSRIIVRDGTSIEQAYELNNVYSDHLEEYYSATYRTPEAYISMFNKFDLECLRHENMFPEGHPLNKYPETRLHLFEFAPKKNGEI